ncbi:hypothetical protein [Caballeronia sp. dw_19]|uniref:hypothetical protein n=1 Tax=Caballeronia sp. dw_19 TaxID=2719791 RepID=UPI001BD253BB|nr:hypothetical protein [Caballeronia sp. dw_19]
MLFLTKKKFGILVATAVLTVCSIASATEQTASSGSHVTDFASDAAPVVNGATVKASQAKPTKAERKVAREQAREERQAERKQARAKRSAELKKLEEAGYRPGQDDPNYPDDLQKAEKKAGIGTSTSQ